MKIIHGDGYSPQELKTFKVYLVPPETKVDLPVFLTPNVLLVLILQPVIFGNLASSMRVVVQNMEKLGISFSDSANSVCLHNLSLCVCFGVVTLA